MHTPYQSFIHPLVAISLQGGIQSRVFAPRLGNSSRDPVSEILQIRSFGSRPTDIPYSVGWSVSNLTPDQSYDADSTTTDELADVLGTLINTLKAKGIIG